jgi:mannose-6-phosphate isomerase
VLSSLSTPTETRQWGSFTVLDQGPGYQVKRLEVKPGERLSLQYHEQRQEHWLLVQGCAEVTLGDRQIQLHPGDSLDIPVKAAHRLANPGAIPVILIEVQMGVYLGEDDIVRLQDDYGRC